MSGKIEPQMPGVNVGRYEFSPTRRVEWMQQLPAGCYGDHHEPRPYVGDPPGPSMMVCYCGAKQWRVESCPTCGHDRAVSA